MQKLLADGAEVDLRDPLDTPLHAAAAAGQVDAARLLLEAGADIELIGLLGTPLHHAVAGGRPAVVELLISYGADVDALDAYGSTALHIAAEQGHEEIAAALLAAGADVNAAHARAQSSPLIDAIHAREPALVRLLIAAGADGNAVDMNCGRSALHIAVDAGDHALVRHLLDSAQIRTPWRIWARRLLRLPKRAAMSFSSRCCAEPAHATWRSLSSGVCSTTRKAAAATVASSRTKKPVERKRRSRTRGSAPQRRRNTMNISALRRVLAPALLAVALVGARPPAASAAEHVDLQLLLAVDVSASVDTNEYLLQMNGLADAFRHPAVIAAIRASAPQGISVALMQWAGPDEQDYSIPWSVVHDLESAEAFAAEIDAATRPLTLGGTAIGDAVIVALSLLEESRVMAARRVIDVSGDGRTNQGTSPAPVRTHAVSLGVTVNGLAIVNEEPELLPYYRDRVIGGPGAFVMQANDFTDFGTAIRLKLIREIEGSPMAGSAAASDPLAWRSAFSSGRRRGCRPRPSRRGGSRPR